MSAGIIIAIIMIYVIWIIDVIITIKKGYVHQQHTYEIKNQLIEMPGPEESVVFVFPKETPKQVIMDFEQRLVEMQNSERKFVTANIGVRFIKTKKESMEVEDFDKTKSDPAEGHKSIKKERHPKGPNTGISK